MENEKKIGVYFYFSMAVTNEKKNNEKKYGTEPEMGYCPFEHWLGAEELGARGVASARGAGARGAQQALWGTAGAARHSRRALGTAGSRGTARGTLPCARLGRACA